VIELCWRDIGLLLTMRAGLGNSAIAAVANEEQLERLAQVGRAGDHRARGGLGLSAPMQATAPARRRRVHPEQREDLVSSGDRADLIVVWA
jgi:acyl-CoA dehydrogenase